MSTPIDNFISKVETETKTSKSGKPFKIWFVELDNGTRLKFGFDKPSYSVGQRLVGYAEANRFGDLEFKSTSSAPAPKAGGGGAPAPGGRKFPLDPTSPEVSIVRQNALTNANATLNALLQDIELDQIVGVVDEDEDGCQTVNLEKVAEKIIEIAYKYAEFSTGQREVKRVKAMADG